MPGIDVDCSTSGVTEFTISSTVPQQSELMFALSGLASISNHGVFDLPSGSVALLFGADSIHYEGKGAQFVVPNGTALQLASQGHFTLNDHIEARIGLDARSELANIDIAVAGGSIIASESGILSWTSNSASTTTIAVASGAVVRSVTPVFINSTGSSSLVLAGRLEGADSTSMLGAGPSVLELQPGYFVEGKVDADTGEDTLVWGGEGDDSFDLATIGTRFLSLEKFEKSGTSAWTFEGEAPHVLNLEVQGGSV